MERCNVGRGRSSSKYLPALSERKLGIGGKSQVKVQKLVLSGRWRRVEGIGAWRRHTLRFIRGATCTLTSIMNPYSVSKVIMVIVEGPGSY